MTRAQRFTIGRRRKHFFSFTRERGGAARLGGRNWWCRGAGGVPGRKLGGGTFGAHQHVPEGRKEQAASKIKAMEGEEVTIGRGKGRARDKIDVHNQKRQSNLKLEKRWLTKDPYFRLFTTLVGKADCCFCFLFFLLLFTFYSLSCRYQRC